MVMNTMVMAPQQLLERATALARSSRSMEIMDLAMILHGYLELTRLDPANGTYRKSMEDAASSLAEAVPCEVFAQAG
jgi:hypothetical protein